MDFVPLDHCSQSCSAGCTLILPSGVTHVRQNLEFQNWGLLFLMNETTTINWCNILADVVMIVNEAVLASHFFKAPTWKNGVILSTTYGYSLVGWFFTHNQGIQLLQRLLLALAFKALWRQLTQRLVELLEGHHTGRLGPVKDCRRQDWQQHQVRSCQVRSGLTWLEYITVDQIQDWFRSYQMTRLDQITLDQIRSDQIRLHQIRLDYIRLQLKSCK